MDRWSEKDKSSQSLELERAADGNGYLIVGGGILVLEPVDTDTIRVSEQLPVKAGTDVEIQDAVTVQRSLRRAR